MLDSIFGTNPNWSMLRPIQGELAWLWGTMFAIGLVLLVLVFVASAFSLGTSRSDMGKASMALMGIKNVMIGLGLLLIGLPILLTVIQAVSTQF